MNVIKVKFIRDGEPKGQAYTYYSENDLELGELVEISEGKKGCVVEIDVPPAEIEKFGDKAKTIKGVWVEPEPVVELENELVIEEPKAFDNLIVVKQLPIIEERLKAKSAEIEEKVNIAKSLVCTEDTVKEIKAIRADLNKQFKAFEEQRKQVETAVLKPLDSFEVSYEKHILSKFKSANADLKSKIDEVESGLKSEKTEELLKYFNEYTQSKNIDFLQIADTRINVTLSESLKSLKSKIAEFVDKVSEDLALIETQECKAEIFVEYKKTLNCSQAITAVVARHKAIEEQKTRQAELEARRQAQAEAAKKVEAAAPAPLEPPKQTESIKQEEIQRGVNDPVKTLAFKVTAPLSKLRELKKFLDDGGYTYE